MSSLVIFISVVSRRRVILTGKILLPIYMFSVNFSVVKFLHFAIEAWIYIVWGALLMEINRDITQAGLK